MWWVGSTVMGKKLSRDQRIAAFDFCSPVFRAPLAMSLLAVRWLARPLPIQPQRLSILAVVKS